MRKSRLFFICLGIVFAISPVANAKWTFSTSSDEMTGEKSAYAVFSGVRPTRKLSFPYHDVESSLVFACDKDSEWVYLWFNDAPNLDKGEIGDGYHKITTRVRWDNDVSEVEFTQNWGSKALHFNYDWNVTQNIKKYSLLKVELSWYSAGRAYFDYSLVGSSKAIDQAQSFCKKI